MSVSDSIRSRICENVRNMSSYSVPRAECAVKLDGNESPYDIAAEFRRDVFDRLRSIEINRYPDPEAVSLRAALGRSESFPREGILLGNGSDEFIQMIVAALTGKTGRVLVPSPTFSMYRLTSLVLGKEVVETELDGNFDIDVADAAETIRREDPDVVFLATPNNPTGNSFSEDRVLEIVERSAGVVVVDEAYFDFSGKSYLPHVEKHENLMVMRTMSKTGFAGARLGMLFARPELAGEVNKTRMPYNINSFSQAVMSFVLERPEAVREKADLVLAERRRLGEELSRLDGLRVYPTDANFFLVEVADADLVFDELVKKDVLVRRFENPPRLRDCLRVTVGTREENERLVSALVGVFSAQVGL